MKISELQPIPRLRDGVTFPIVIAGQNLSATIEQIWESMPGAVVDFAGIVDTTGATILQKSLYSDTCVVFDTATGTFLCMRPTDSSTYYTLFQGREHYIDSGGVRTDCLFRNSTGSFYYYLNGFLRPLTTASSGGSQGGEGGTTIDPMLAAQVEANTSAIRNIQQSIGDKVDESVQRLYDALAADNILTPAEKKQILIQLIEIKQEFTDITERAAVLGVSAIDYENVYDALILYLTGESRQSFYILLEDRGKLLLETGAGVGLDFNGVLGSLYETTEIDRAEFERYFTDYFRERDALVFDRFPSESSTIKADALYLGDNAYISVKEEDAEYQLPMLDEDTPTRVIEAWVWVEDSELSATLTLIPESAGVCIGTDIYNISEATNSSLKVGLGSYKLMGHRIDGNRTIWNVLMYSPATIM